MHNNAKNDLEATALQEVGKLELIVAEVRKLGATDVAGRSGLSRAGGRSGALRLSGSSGLALRLLSGKELILTVDVGVGEARNLASEWDAFSALMSLGKARPGIRRQNGTCFPFAAFGGNCVPDLALRTGCIFRLRPRTENASQSFAKNGMRFPALTSDVRAHLGAPARAHLSQTFLPLLRHFVDRSVACLHARVYSNR